MSSEVEQATSAVGHLNLSDISPWDEHYDNPKAEIILVSNDKVGFRVDAWQFKKESAFIRDLITFPSDQALESSPIELDHNSKIVRYFVDFIVIGSTSAAQISMSEFEELFKLSDKFMAEKVDKALMVAMRLRVRQRPTPQDLNPWTVFKFAAGREAYELARSCIRAFENARIRHADIYEARVSKFEGIPANYLAGLLLAGIDYRRPYVNKPDLFLDLRSWDHVAEEFHVK